MKPLTRTAILLSLMMAVATIASAQDTVRTYLRTGKVNAFVGVDSVKMTGKYMRVYSAAQASPVAVNRIDSVRVTYPQYVCSDALERYTIVYPSSSASQKAFAQTLQEKIKSSTGCNMPLRTDAGSIISSYEIVVGDTRRSESKKLMATLTPHSWAIGAEGNKVIIVGSDDNHLAIALNNFCKRILNNDQKTGEGHMRFTTSDTLSKRYGFKQNSLRGIVRNSYPHVINMVRLFNVPARNGLTIGQGCATDGKLAYMAVRNSASSLACIYRYDLKTLKMVDKTEDMYIAHANDIAVDTTRQKFYVCHAPNDSNLISQFDMRTLKRDRIIALTERISALDYVQDKDIFVGSRSGRYIRYIGQDFKFIGNVITRSDYTGLTAQGMGCDKEFMYFPMSGSYNELCAYKIDSGDYAGMVRLETGMESESIFFIDDVPYVSFCHNCSTLYRLDISLKFE